MKVPFSPPDITEEEIAAVGDALRSGWITTGPRTKQMESEVAKYCGTEHAVCLNSATACMEMTLRALGVGPGDEVITSAYTYTATASSICHVGAKPVIIDCGKDSYEIDYDQIAEAITDRTKVIMPIDVAGVLCDYERIYCEIHKKKSLYQPTKGTLQEAFDRVIVLADAAHAFGAVRKGKRAGEWADFTCFSFHAVKNLTTAEGGAVVWKEREGIDSEALYHQYMLLSLHGQSKDALAKTKLGAWEYDIIAPYYKCNMTDVMAAIGLVQLRRYPDLLARRKQLIAQYDEAMQRMGLDYLKHHTEDGESSGHLYLVRIPGYTREQVNDLITKMAEKEIALNVHYKPLPLLTAYQNIGYDPKDYPHAMAQYSNEVSIPLHTCLTDEQVQFIVDSIEQYLVERSS